MIDQARMQEIIADITSRKIDWSADLEGMEE